MKILSVEVLDQQASTSLRRGARLARREEAEYFRKADPAQLLQQDISQIRMSANRQSSEPVESPLPPVASQLVGKYEKHDEIALLLFAREKRGPVLVQFAGEPSKAGEGRLRQAAKARNFTVRFFRLTGGWAILEVHPPVDPEEFDGNFLKRLGVQL